MSKPIFPVACVPQRTLHKIHNVDIFAQLRVTSVTRYSGKPNRPSFFVILWRPDLYTSANDGSQQPNGSHQEGDTEPAILASPYKGKETFQYMDNGDSKRKVFCSLKNGKPQNIILVNSGAL